MPTTPPTMTCDAAMSDDVLQAARKALEPHLRWPEAQWRNLPEKQRPLIPLLMALLDSTQAVAKAITDNAFDDSAPLGHSLVDDLAKQARFISDDILGAAQAPANEGWSLPSMTGKELV